MIPLEINEFNTDIRWQIGQRIQEERIRKGLSGIDVAVYLGIQKNQISRIENGRANCTVPQLFILAQLLACSVDYLMFGRKRLSYCTKEQEMAIKALIAAFS